MRPVNLIPAEERRGAARAAGAADAPPIRVYILLGALGAALLCVLALVLVSNNVNSKKEELAKVQVQEQGAKQVADALRPYGQFAQIQAARKVQIAALASSRFNWERAVRQLSRAIPTNVWLLNLAGTVSPAIEVEGAGGSGDVSTLREKVQAPAFAITGCTYSQHAVARMMTRMRNLDDVTSVQLAKSARKDEQGTSGTAVTATQNDQQASSQESSDCVGSQRITKFDMLIVFGAAPGATGDASGAATAGAASSTAQNLGTAQNAAASAQGASSAAGGASTGGTP
jgi:Tfp pilus assembly protein PilN